MGSESTSIAFTKAVSELGMVRMVSPTWMLPASRRPEIDSGCVMLPRNISLMVRRRGFSRARVMGSEASSRERSDGP